ncbi:hypothetical protein [Sulfitobacter sp. JB4-11]|uniref:hypothetical protein n=1 Tax=Sulfitobacter rhodophyticola TaxID=3238304 RepID=UPI003517774E
MSAPDTNIDKQTRRHKAPLLGIGIVAIFAGALFLALTGWTLTGGEEDEGVDAVVPVATDQ